MVTSKPILMNGEKLKAANQALEDINEAVWDHNILKINTTKMKHRILTILEAYF